MNGLSGKVALVTGASRGIGRAIAMTFANNGADIVATARTAEALTSLVQEVESLDRHALAIPADIAVESDINRIVEEAEARFGQIDILVNNAATIHGNINLVDFDMALWRDVVSVNLVSVALLTKAVLPIMIARHSGKIINISSSGGRKGGRGRSAYRAAKAGVISLTESVAAEVKEHGIDVTCICPAAVDTDGLRLAVGSNAEVVRSAMSPSEIAEIALFLASDASSAITGTSIDALGLSNPLFR